MAVAVTSFDNPEVMQVPQASGQTLFFCSGVALVDCARRTEKVAEGRSGVHRAKRAAWYRQPAAAAHSQLRRLGRDGRPATIQNNDADEEVGWGIDNADSVIDGNNNIQVTARIVVKEESATVLRVAYHAVILG